MTIENWFPTPVYFADAPEETKVKIQKEYDAKQGQIDKDLRERTWGDNVHTTFHIKNALAEYSLTELRAFIFDSTKEFCKAFYKNPVNISLTESWINRQAKFQYQERHTHSPAVLSGVYYVQTTGDDGSFRVFKPSDAMEEDQNAAALYANTPVLFTPRPGRILIFPGWVAHGVCFNSSEHTRISVAFNFYKT